MTPHAKAPTLQIRADTRSKQRPDRPAGNGAIRGTLTGTLRVARPAIADCSRRKPDRNQTICHFHNFRKDGLRWVLFATRTIGGVRMMTHDSRLLFVLYFE